MIFTDVNIIYKAINKTIKSSDKSKYSTQLLETNKLLYAVNLAKEISEDRYNPSKGKKFVLKERGKSREVTNNVQKDKIVNHIICDEILMPSLKNFLIYDNSASQKNKGVSFARKRFKKHLRNFYNENKSNDGYILLGDFKGYYKNINHEKAKKVLEKFLLRNKKIDENSRDYCLKLINKILKTFDNGIDIGNQISQSIGIIFPYKFDNFIKIKQGIKYYGRYSDDFYIIHKDKEKLKFLLTNLKLIAKEFGIFINEKKTKIVKLSDFFRFLQCGYSLQNNGRIIIKINTKALTRFRHKLKAYKRLLDAKKLQEIEIENIFKSWLCNYYKIMSRQQILNLTKYYEKLFRRVIKWRKNSRLSYLTARR